MAKIAWQYTVRLHLPDILREGVLVPADPHIGPPAMLAKIRRLYGNERPALWFSLRQDWEPTANKGGASTRAETLEVGGGLVRFGLPEDRLPYTWTFHVNTSGLRKKGARALASGALEQGADPADWRVVYEPVSIAECSIEVFNAETEMWEPFKRG